MKRLPHAVCGVIGEGEITFVELLRKNNFNAQSLKTCKGIIFKTSGSYEITAQRPLIENLDSINIPNRKNLSIDNKYSFLPTMITGRGCTGKCAFCYEGRKNEGGKKLRLNSAERCIKEFNYLSDGIKKGYICILDDTFVADTKRLKEFCKELTINHKGKIKWFCEARVDTLVRFPDILPMMIEAGLIRLQVGGESGSQEVLNSYKKEITLDQITAAVDLAKKSGLLSIFINFIIGGAHETKSTFEKTKKLALELLNRAPGCVSIGSSFFTPYPGTPMNDNPNEYGIEILDEEVVTGFGDKHVFCRTKELSKYEILEMGYSFNQELNKNMMKLSKHLPKEIIEKHYEAFYKYDLSTEWYECLSSNLTIDSYYKSRYQAKTKKFGSIRKNELLNSYPIRNVSLISSSNKKYLIPIYDGSIIALDELESILLELSSGKLTFREICDTLTNSFSNLPPEKLYKAIRDRYSKFDKEYLVVWKNNIN